MNSERNVEMPIWSCFNLFCLKVNIYSYYGKTLFDSVIDTRRMQLL